MASSAKILDYISKDAKVGSFAVRFIAERNEHLRTTHQSNAEFMSEIELLMAGARSSVAFIWHHVTGGSVEYTVDHSEKMIIVTYKDKGITLQDGLVEIADGIMPESKSQTLLAKNKSLGAKGENPLYLSTLIDLPFADFDPEIVSIERWGPGTAMKLRLLQTYVSWRDAQRLMLKPPKMRKAV